MNLPIDENLDPVYLREILNYDPITGILKWKKRIGIHCVPGKIAGSVHHSGYWNIRINHALYRAHRLAWLYVYGSWPVEGIDHIDGNRRNNAIDNLRDVNKRTNGQNQARHRKGCKAGARCRASTRKWESFIHKNGKYVHLGTFGTEQEAHDRYMDEIRKEEI